MGYRRNRPRWHRGGRDTFPLAMAGVVASMMLAFVASVVWAAFGSGPARPGIARSEEAETREPVPRTAALPAAPADPAGQPAAGRPVAESAIDVAAAGAVAEAASERAAATSSATPLTERRSVVTPVAARRSPRRPMAPADTTAAGHAGLAEELLAAGDTAAAIAAYSAFLARNTDPALERAAIAKLRRIFGARRD